MTVPLKINESFSPQKHENILFLASIKIKVQCYQAY